eukprot:536598-Prorocentrum_minimum.AAC.1
MECDLVPPPHNGDFISSLLHTMECDLVPPPHDGDFISSLLHTMEISAQADGVTPPPPRSYVYGAGHRVGTVLFKY